MRTIQDILQFPSARLTQHLGLSIATRASPFGVLEFRIERGSSKTHIADIAITPGVFTIKAAASRFEGPDSLNPPPPKLPGSDLSPPDFHDMTS